MPEKKCRRQHGFEFGISNYPTPVLYVLDVVWLYKMYKKDYKSGLWYNLVNFLVPWFVLCLALKPLKVVTISITIFFRLIDFIWYFVNFI